jgi:hypothetical protein
VMSTWTIQLIRMSTCVQEDVFDLNNPIFWDVNEEGRLDSQSFLSSLCFLFLLVDFDVWLVVLHMQIRKKHPARLISTKHMRVRRKHHPTASLIWTWMELPTTDKLYCYLISMKSQVRFGVIVFFYMIEWVGIVHEPMCFSSSFHFYT